MGIFNWSTISTIVFIGYIGVTLQKLYQLMNPLYGVEINPDEPTVNPIWQANQTFSMICYLSSNSRASSFNLQEINRRKLLLWHQPELTFNQLQKELSYEILIVDGVKRINSLSNAVSSTTPTLTKVNRTYVASPEIWSKLRHNESTVYLHVLVTANKHNHQNNKIHDIDDITETAETNYQEDKMKQLQPSQGDVLYGSVKLVKYDKIPKAFRHRYLLSDFGWVNVTQDEARKASMSADTVISYWKPEVAVRLVTDLSVYPYELVPDVLHRHIFESTLPPSSSGSSSSSNTAKQQQQRHKTAQKQFYYKPPIHVDEIGLTSDKYIPLNHTVTELPLKLTYDSMSLQRWLLMQNVEQSLSSQKNVGFTDKDIDDVRRLISDTSIYLLGITILASLLHLLFEFLAFQSDITFWRENKSLAGLSTRTVITDLFSQIIIFLFLLESDTSMLVIIPTFFGILIQAWKVQKATGFGVVRDTNRWIGYSLECSRWKTVSNSDNSDSNNNNNSTSGSSSSSSSSSDASNNNSSNSDSRETTDAVDSIQTTTTTTTAAAASTRRSDSPSKNNNNNNSKKVNKKDDASTNTTTLIATTTASTSEILMKKGDHSIAASSPSVTSSGISDDELTAVTLVADQMATSYLGLLLLPIALLMSLRSLLVDKHASWYSWGIGSLTGFVYTFGFVLMCPQLFINHKLKSVAALPWKFLIYKFLNTFIDDLFAFIIKMPTMHRLSVFRDDIVFLVYIYQRWIYRIDTSRPVDK